MPRGLSAETPNRLLINEGVLYLNYGETGERMLGATRGGTEFEIETDIHTPEIDGAKGPVMGTRRVVESIARLSGELLEMTHENFLMTITGADSTVALEGYNSIRRTRELTASDHFTNVACVGQLVTGEEVVIILYNALNDEGVTVGQEDRDEATLPVQFTAHYDPADMDTEPWEVRFPA